VESGFHEPLAKNYVPDLPIIFAYTAINHELHFIWEKMRGIIQVVGNWVAHDRIATKS